MDNLPQELIDRISSFLDPGDLSNTLTVSYQFQLAAERHCQAYNSFALHSGDESKKQLLNTFSEHPRRFSYLRDVVLYTELPDLRVRKRRKTKDVVVSLEELACRESQEELDANDEFFTKHVLFLFETLKRFEDAAREQGHGPGRIALTIVAPDRHVDTEICLHRRYTSWRTHLLRPVSLPTLRCIRSLRVEGGDQQDPIDHDEIDTVVCKLDLRLICDLITRMPELENLSWVGGGDEWTPSSRSAAIAHYYQNYEGPRRDSRHHFAEALATATLPKSLRNASLNFLCPLDHSEETDQRGNLPNLILPSSRGDPFSSALRAFAHQHRRLNLRVLSDSTLFWPLEPAADAPSWPNLEDLHVYFHNASPAGTWYFQGPEGEGSQTSPYAVTTEMYPPLADNDDDRDWDLWTSEAGYDEDGGVSACFRVSPLERFLLPFLTAFVKTAEQMSRLRRYSLWTTLLWNPHDVEEVDLLQITTRSFKRRSGWGIAYAASGTQGFEGEPGEVSSMRRIWWKTGAWRPDRELNGQFQKIGAYNGSDLIEYYGNNEGGDELVETTVFERFEN
ncbi:hypothetical protein P171DRAFT_410034 [Karstenula rhodostoma CBS 690.94]|uniref:F-box domain-containing protein n=1 Tax=Karstenula rhodostoma CBS 690.94 TaxID=1392251 RepID=A0A9P4PJ71_9PLEO|nr:hypothetical protein P171DRAFT_410034 [Karstenula rhodostoma CBS 690.94]